MVADRAGLHINPAVLVSRFEAGFDQDSAMWRMPRQLDELFRLIRKYAFLRQWLELDQHDPLLAPLDRLIQCRDLSSALDQEREVRRMVRHRFAVAT